MTETSSQSAVTDIVTISASSSIAAITVTTTVTSGSASPSATQTPSLDAPEPPFRSHSTHAGLIAGFVLIIVVCVSILSFLCWYCARRSRRRRDARDLAALQQTASQTAPPQAAAAEGHALQEFYQPGARLNVTPNHAMESNQVQEFYSSGRAFATGSEMQAQGSVPVAQREDDPEPVLKPAGVSSRFQ